MTALLATQCSRDLQRLQQLLLAQVQQLKLVQQLVRVKV